MSYRTRRVLHLLGGLLAAAWAGDAAAQQYLHLTGAGDGGQLQLGSNLPIPLQAPAPGVGFPPSLGVPPISGVTPAGATTAIAETVGGALQFPAGVLSAMGPRTRPVFATQPNVFQYATSLTVQWPAAPIVLAPGGGPGLPGGTPVVFTGPGVVVTYTGGANAFGGPGLFAITPGPGAAGGSIPGRPLTVFANFQGKLPATATAALLLGPGVTSLQPGASAGAPAIATPGFSADPGTVMAAFGPAGTVIGPVPCVAPCPAPSTRITSSQGIPWTTGSVTITRFGSPPQIFFHSGTDMRVAGVGNLSLVSSALSMRSLRGPESARGWLRLTLPEPGAALAGAAALAALVLCRGAVRRARGASAPR